MYSNGMCFFEIDTYIAPDNLSIQTTSLFTRYLNLVFTVSGESVFPRDVLWSNNAEIWKNRYYVLVFCVSVIIYLYM